MITLGALAGRFGLAVWPATATEGTIVSLAPLEAAGPSSLAPLLSRAQLPLAGISRAGAFLCSFKDPSLKRPLLLAADARLALAELLRFFQPPQPKRGGIHASAVVDARARVAVDAWVGPFCVVEAGARIGAACVLTSHVYVGPDAELGAGCRLASHVVIEARSRLAAGVELSPGAVVGGPGFGFAADPKGELHELASLGDVWLGEGVRLGAHSCVDRATLGTTRIGAGTKIDNLVQVGHNVQIGERTVLCAQVGVGGSAELGVGVQAGGQVGIADHVAVGAGARLAAQAGVIGDVGADQEVGGTPAVGKQRWLRTAALSGQLGGILSRVRDLERMLKLVEHDHPVEESAERADDER